MSARSWVLAAVLVAGCGGGPSPEQPRPGGAPGLPQPSPEVVANATKEFGRFRDGFLAWYYESHPVRATQVGVHAYDRLLPSMERVAVQQRIQDLLDWDGRLQDIPFRALEGAERYDYAVLEYAIRAELLDLEELRLWATSPRMYTDAIAEGVASLVGRPFAPVAERMAALQSRLRAAPEVLNAARENLENPPAEWTQLAITDAEGLLTYIDALPELLGSEAAAATDGLESARSALAGALNDYVAWLRTDLLPRSTGSYRLGRYFFARKLLYSEHIDLSVEALDRLNEQEITSYRDELQKVVAAVAPGRSVRAFMDSLSMMHPAPSELVPAARELTRRARDWTLGSGMVTVLDSTAPVVRPSPSYARERFSRVDAPGPLDSVGLATYYELTNALPSWTEAEQASFLSYFNNAALLGLTLHQTFPGRAVELAYARTYPSDVRKVFTPRSLAEGWAQYAEQQALQGGFPAQDSTARIAAIWSALKQHARWYASLHIHALEEPMDTVVQRFMDIAYMREAPGRREVLRATYDPMYLAAALGRVQIVQLRKDYQAYVEKEKKTFTELDFNDRLLSLGLPLPLAREVLMPHPASQMPPRARSHPRH